MGLWILLALMTALAVIALLMPLMKPSGVSGSDHEQDVAVYKDQIREINRDLKRGSLPAEEADAARAEIARRLLNADEQAKPEQASERSKYARLAALCIILIVPIVSLTSYLILGNPDLPGQALQTRLEKPLNQQTLPEMVARVEQHLKKNPDDGQGWEVLAPVYVRAGRLGDAIIAYKQAVRLLGEEPVARLESMAETMVVRDKGQINDEAQTIFARANELDPQSVKARFYLAMAKGQRGDKAGSINDWKALIASADSPDVPWVAVAKRELAVLEGGEDAVPSTALTPNAEQQAMIQSMVEGLASRLAEDGGSVEEWGRLMRSYMVLKQPEKAQGALVTARTAFADDEAKLAELNQMATTLGILK